MLAIRRRKSVVSEALFGGKGTTVADIGDAIEVMSTGYGNGASTQMTLTAAVPND
jgi:hypothetical protein